MATLTMSEQEVPQDPSSIGDSDPQTRSQEARAFSHAQLLTIDFSRLKERHKDEIAKLLNACQRDGVLYLDFSSYRDAHMPKVVEDIFDVSKELFMLSEEEKMTYDIDLLGDLKLNGYKPVGRNFGGINGQHDGFESYTIPGKPDLGPSFTRPPVLTDALPKVLDFCAEAHNILHIILASLSAALDLLYDNSLDSLHRNEVASSDIIRLLHYLPQPASETGDPQTPHTDLGSLTLLFAKSPGLQILAPQSEKWAFVMPKEGCAIVNVGDGLSKLTGGLLHSCLHKVGPLPGQEMEERYSFAYLQRAEDDVKLKPLPGFSSGGDTNPQEVSTSRQWLEKKFGMLRANTREEGTESHKILTGRTSLPS